MATHNGGNDLIGDWHAVLSQPQNQLYEQGLEGGKQAAVFIMCEYKVFHPTTN